MIEKNENESGVEINSIEESDLVKKIILNSSVCTHEFKEHSRDYHIEKIIIESFHQDYGKLFGNIVFTPNTYIIKFDDNKKIRICGWKYAYQFDLLLEIKKEIKNDIENKKYILYKNKINMKKNKGIVSQGNNNINIMKNKGIVSQVNKIIKIIHSILMKKKK